MLESIRRRREDEQGFTLIELMVVVLIIAILIAIAIPTFLGAQDRARDRAAQSDLRNAFTAAKSIATDFEGDWKTATTCTGTSVAFTSALTTENGSLTYAADATSISETSIGVVVSGSCKELLLTRASTSGTFFCFSAHQDGTTDRKKSATETDINTYAKCDAFATSW